MKPTELLHPEQRRPSKAYLGNELRKAIITWREGGYPNTTDTMRTSDMKNFIKVLGKRRLWQT